jgi:hypothetical protein
VCFKLCTATTRFGASPSQGHVLFWILMFGSRHKVSGTTTWELFKPFKL